MDFLGRLFDGSYYMPHGHCFLWEPGVLWTRVLADAGIALAYFAIPASLLYFVSKRKSVPFKGVFILFASFILACGATHVMGVITVWDPLYRLDSAVKSVTALISIATAIVLIPVIPRALSLRTPEELEAANRALAEENAERRKAEEGLTQARNGLEVRVAERTAELADFAHVVSHDLKAPLQSMAIMTGRLEEYLAGSPGAEVQETLGQMREKIAGMSALIDGILSCSKAGTEAAAPECVDIRALLDEVVDTIIPPDNIEITMDGDVRNVYCDRTRLRQVFQNLLTNAIKYNDKEKGWVRVRCVRAAGSFRFSFADNGIGIDRKHFDEVFQMFRTFSGPAHGGNGGVGLAIVKKIVEGYGGRIWLESKPGCGATFYFTLPDLRGPRKRDGLRSIRPGLAEA